MALPPITSAAVCVRFDRRGGPLAVSVGVAGDSGGSETFGISASVAAMAALISLWREWHDAPPHVRQPGTAIAPWTIGKNVTAATSSANAAYNRWRAHQGLWVGLAGARRPPPTEHSPLLAMLALTERVVWNVGGRMNMFGRCPRR